MLAVAAAGLLAMTPVAAGAKAVPPDEWAESVCSDVVDWAGQLETVSQDFDGAETPSEAEDALESAVEETTALIKGLRKAGTPDVEGGKASARAFITVFKDARGLFREAANDAADLPVDPDGFREARTGIDEALDDGLTALGSDVDAVQADADAELQGALDEDSSCREIFGNEAASSAP